VPADPLTGMVSPVALVVSRIGRNVAAVASEMIG
jgi:hypothetical protein